MQERLVDIKFLSQEGEKGDLPRQASEDVIQGMFYLVVVFSQMTFSGLLFEIHVKIPFWFVTASGNDRSLNEMGWMKEWISLL